MRLTDTTLIRLGRAAGLASVVLAVAGSSVFLVLGEPRALITTFSAHTGVIAVGFGTFAWLVVPRQPRNPEVWTLAASALLGGIYSGAWASLVLLSRAAGLEVADLYGLTVSQSMDAIGNLAAVPLFVQGATTHQPLMLPMSLGWLLFPDGKLPGSRWRWVAATSIVAGVGVTIGYTFGGFVPGSNVTLEASEEITGWQGTLYDAGQTVLIATILLALSSLVVRFRRADALVRQQFRWVMWGAMAFFVSGFYPVALGNTIGEPGAALLVGEAALVVSYGMAVAKGRLYDIDVIISRTFVYGTLAAFIGAVYVAVVVGAGSALGGGADPNPVLAVAATALVAVAFQPLRARLQRIANRIVYGRRATPYQVLSEFSRQVAATDESLLRPVARLLTEGTAASAAAVWTAEDGHLRRVSVWPEDETVPHVVAVDRGAVPAIPGADTVFPVVHEGDVLGALSLSMRPGQPLSGPDIALADELTAGMGLVMRNLLLTRALEGRVRELRASRQRIVAVQDETRRRLERDLHDGAQQRLVALKVKLALTRQIAERDGATRTLELLGALSTQADEAVVVLREFARGLYPPLLQAEGLRAALTAAAGRMPIAVDVAADGVSRYPRDVEATVYFCVLEALHNVVKSAGASSAQITLHADGEALRFTVRDAGAGFDPATVRLGSGLQDIRDRIDAAGGDLTIASAPGQGTTVAGSLPLPAEALA